MFHPETTENDDDITGMFAIMHFSIFCFLVKFEVLTAASMKMTDFWVVAPCNLVEVYRLFRGACRLRHQGDECFVFPSAI
jgi:hypothetical protein